MGYFDVDEYFQIIDQTELVNSNGSLADLLDRILLEKCRHIHANRDCRTRTKMFIRPQNVPIIIICSISTLSLWCYAN